MLLFLRFSFVFNVHQHTHFYAFSMCKLLTAFAVFLNWYYNTDLEKYVPIFSSSIFIYTTFFIQYHGCNTANKVTTSLYSFFPLIIMQMHVIRITDFENATSRRHVFDGWLTTHYSSSGNTNYSSFLIFHCCYCYIFI